MIPKLISISGPEEGKVFPINDADVTIGRGPANSVCIPDPLLSRQHCRISRDGPAFNLQDLGSFNGTFVNGAPIKQQAIAHGDLIKTGASILLFVCQEESDSESSQLRLAEDDPAMQSTIYLRREDSHYFNALKGQTDLPPSARTARNFRALLQIGLEINAIRDLETLQRRLLELIFTVTPAGRGAILLADSGAEDFSSVFALHRSGRQEKSVSVSRSIAQRVMREGVGILSASLADDSSMSSAHGSGAQSALAAPLTTSGEVFGVVYLEMADTAAGFDSDHLQLVTAISNLAAVALDTARYVERLNNETKRLQDELDFGRTMIAESPPMKEVRAFIAKVAPTDSTVLIRGESGTGKEMVARAIHLNSPRAKNAFIAINCAVLPENLIESELFGHEKGAFTGAIAQKKGKFEMAEGGTVFLDEIGELAPRLQAKLLRVIQENEFERVGGLRPIKFNARLIAATNKDLDAAIQSREFREDLFFRLNVLALTLPPLRLRRDDIPLLADYFVTKYAARCQRRIKGVTASARACLERYDWPGNVRELESAIQRAVVMSATEFITPEDLPDDVLESEATDDGAPSTPFPGNPMMITPPTTKYHDAIKEARKQIIMNAIEQASGNLAEAAKLLGLHPNNLYRLIRNLNLKSRLKK
ncbi:MAG TPA: sigma 54-interacting transcriptional regulator [Blastocatellia bacterium]|jgi:Nif-specific regulatory protein|nr:sigma 54-interacting transcriptional regulator [Blastocatellia bacterium]